VQGGEREQHVRRSDREALQAASHRGRTGNGPSVTGTTDKRYRTISDATCGGGYGGCWRRSNRMREGLGVQAALSASIMSRDPSRGQAFQRQLGTAMACPSRLARLSTTITPARDEEQTTRGRASQSSGFPALLKPRPNPNSTAPATTGHSDRSGLCVTCANTCFPPLYYITSVWLSLPWAA